MTACFRPWMALGVCCAILAWSAASPAARAETPKVVASIKPIHSLIATVMQGVGSPTLLLKGGQSPHTYSLKPSDARALEAAGVIFWVGPGIDGFLAKPLEALGGRAHVVTLSEVEGMLLLKGRVGGAWEGHDDSKGSPHADEHDDHADTNIDMHLWLDPENARRIVSAAVAALSQRDPANAERYAANGRATDARIQALTREITASLAPIRQVPYVVFHDAYHYFERRFGTNAVGSISVHSGRSPGAKRLHEVRKKIIDVDARCVFSEPQFQPALAKTVIEGTAARSGVLDPVGAELKAGEEAYFVLMRNLAEALRGCLAPRS